MNFPASTKDLDNPSSNSKSSDELSSPLKAPPKKLRREILPTGPLNYASLRFAPFNKFSGEKGKVA